MGLTSLLGGNIALFLAAVLMVTTIVVTSSKAEEDEDTEHDASTARIPQAHSEVDPEVHSLGLIITKSTKRCQYVRAAHLQDKAIMEFRQTRGRPTFDISVTGPENKVVYSVTSEDHDGEGRVFFMTSDVGEYAFCIDTTKHSLTESLIVEVTIALASKYRTPRNDPLLNVMRRAASSMAYIAMSDRQVLSREAEHRSTLESNNTRLMVQWILTTVSIIGLTAGQIILVKRKFESRVSGRGRNA